MTKWKCKLCGKPFLIPSWPKVYEVAIVQNKMAWHHQATHPDWKWERE